MTIREKEQTGMAEELWLSRPFVRRVLDAHGGAKAIVSGMGRSVPARRGSEAR